MLSVRPGATFTALLEANPGDQPGIAIENTDGTTVVARTVAGIVELEAGSGTFAKDDLVAPSQAGTYVLLWDNGGAPPTYVTEELRVTYTAPELVEAVGPGYATPDELRAELEVDVGALADPAAERLIRTAERLVDRLVGPRRAYNSDATGRKLDVTALTAGQARAVRDATVLLAGVVHANPAAFTPAAGKRVKGPDFEVEYGDAAGGPSSSVARTALVEAVGVLDSANVRSLIARAV
jgi:hypothetical protein